METKNMGMFSTIASVGSKVLPFVGKAVSALPVVSSIAKGIGSLFGLGGKNRISEGANRFGNAMDYASQQLPRFGDHAMNMSGQGFSMFNGARRDFGGAINAFRGGDIAGGIQGFSTGLQNLYSQGSNLFNQGRQAVDMVRGFAGGMRDMFGGGQGSGLSGLSRMWGGADMSPGLAPVGANGAGQRMMLGANGAGQRMEANDDWRRRRALAQ